jgi:hypothetical protein
VWRTMSETLETGITSPRLATLEEIQRRTVELLAQSPPPSRHATRPADGLAANGCTAYPGTTSSAKANRSTLYGPDSTHTRSMASSEKPSATGYEDREPAEEETAEPKKSSRRKPSAHSAHI